MKFKSRGNGKNSGSIRNRGNCGSSCGCTASDILSLVSGNTEFEQYISAITSFDIYTTGATIMTGETECTLVFTDSSGNTFDVTIPKIDVCDFTGCTSWSDLLSVVDEISGCTVELKEFSATTISTLSAITSDIEDLSALTSGHTNDISELSGCCSANTESIQKIEDEILELSACCSGNSEAIENLSALTSGHTNDISELSGCCISNSEAIEELSEQTDIHVTGVTHTPDTDGCGVTSVINMSDSSKDVKVRWLDSDWIKGCMDKVNTYSYSVNGQTSDYEVTSGDTVEFQSSGESITVTNDDGTINFEVNCPEEMTRAQLRALRTAGNLKTNCHYIINNPNPQGTLQLEKVLLHAVDENTLSGCYLKTAHDNTAWNGSYDIDLDDVQYVHDHLRNNKVTGNAAIIIFPFGVTSVSGNEVHSGARLNYVGGTVTNNTINSISRVTVNSGTFRDNTVSNESRVTISTTSTVEENLITGRATLTVTGAAAFSRNNITSQARVNTSRTCYRNDFTSYSNSILSGAGQLNDSKIHGESRCNISSAVSTEQLTMQGHASLTMTGGNFSNSTISEDAIVTITAGTNFNNHVKTRAVYNQVGAGYLRYSTISAQSSVTNGDTNINNITVKNTSNINTTGSAGDLSRCTFDRATVNGTNCPQLFLRDSGFSNGAAVTATGAARLYFYRGDVDSGGRLLVSAGSRVDCSYTTVSSLGYIQGSASGGFLIANYCNVKGLGYIRNTTANANATDRCTVSSSGRISFEGNAKNCRVYYSKADSGASIYHTGSSDGCYMYYVTATSFAQVYSQNSIAQRLYYSKASSYSYIRSINCSNAQYFYYCNADARGYLQTQTNTGVTRFYAVNANSQSIVELRNSTGNLYYSNFNAYFYAYITRTGGTSLGLFGIGRRSITQTDPVAITPYAIGSAWLNF
jgi:hypothetical protein